MEEGFKAESKVQLAGLEREGKLSLDSNESMSVLAHFLSETVPKDPCHIYQNNRKDINYEKRDNVTLLESHSQEKTQIHGNYPSPRPLHLKIT